jgi:hypothetical protein
VAAKINPAATTQSKGRIARLVEVGHPLPDPLPEELFIVQNAQRKAFAGY